MRKIGGYIRVMKVYLLFYSRISEQRNLWNIFDDPKKAIAYAEREGYYQQPLVALQWNVVEDGTNFPYYAMTSSTDKNLDEHYTIEEWHVF